MAMPTSPTVTATPSLVPRAVGATRQCESFLSALGGWTSGMVGGITDGITAFDFP